jgi:hypothetical protein
VPRDLVPEIEERGEGMHRPGRYSSGLVAVYSRATQNRMPPHHPVLVGVADGNWNFTARKVL